VDWAIRDTMPKWAKQLIGHTDPNPIERAARRSVVWSIINGLHTAAGTPRSSAGPAARRRWHHRRAHEPRYVLGSDPELSRDEVERSFEGV
jgi:hypothetical protein